MAQQRRGGIIQFAINGVIYDAKGDFQVNYGRAKREAIVGSDGKIHGFKETAQPAFIEGEITDRGDLDTTTLTTAQGATVTLGLANGKTAVLRNAFYAGEGTVHTEEGNMDIRFEGDGEEVG